MSKRAIVLVNLGTPKALTLSDVKTYLGEFLMDPYVLDIHPVWRWLLVHGLILRTRPKKSLHAYSTIWTEQGSPLMVYSLELCRKFQAGTEDSVRLAMRYGEPSIKNVLQSVLEDSSIEDLWILPLYPQYSLAATETVIAESKRVLQELGYKGRSSFLPEFFNHPAWINAVASSYSSRAKLGDFDHVLMSFHGVPERHVQKTDPTGMHCLKVKNCCEVLCEANRKCYRSQCVQSAQAIAKVLQLQPHQYSVSFQSRLGRTPWIQPYTDDVLPKLAKEGVQKLAVLCPAFVADCLETLEEIQVRAKEDFVTAGGKDLWLVPSLNADDVWVSGLHTILKDARASR